MRLTPARLHAPACCRSACPALQLLTGQVAFKGWQWGAILEHVALGDPPGRPPVPEGAPEDYALLMEACWQHDPARRPTFHEVRAAVVVCWAVCRTARVSHLVLGACFECGIPPLRHAMQCCL